MTCLGLWALLAFCFIVEVSLYSYYIRKYLEEQRTRSQSLPCSVLNRVIPKAQRSRAANTEATEMISDLYFKSESETAERMTYANNPPTSNSKARAINLLVIRRAYHALQHLSKRT
jgi:hypothetical protein